jgi:hypothetical protein
MSGSVGKEDIYMNSDFNQLAEDLIAERRLVEARTMLEKAISQMPAGWKPSRDDGKALSIAFWYEEEFLAWVQQYGRRLNKRRYGYESRTQRLGICSPRLQSRRNA